MIKGKNRARKKAQMNIIINEKADITTNLIEISKCVREEYKLICQLF